MNTTTTRLVGRGLAIMLTISSAFTQAAEPRFASPGSTSSPDLMLAQIWIPLPGLAKPPAPAPAPAPAPTPPPLAASKTQLQKPATVLADVIKNYNDSSGSCTQAGSNVPRGLYYCSGVLIRTVDDGNFAPWSYSPTAVQIGATSYAWLRHDTGITRAYHPAGFILRNRVDAMSRKLPGLETGFVCLYPFDSSTSPGNGMKGCGLKPRVATPLQGNNNASYAYGSCATLGVTTAAAWNADFNKQGQVSSKQCSWNVEDPVGWNASIAAHTTYPAFRTVWNEILLNNYNNGNSMPQYISAFFYDVKKAGGLETARNFQRKMNTAGYNVPILRLDFTAAAANRFTYAAADQAVVQ